MDPAFVHIVVTFLALRAMVYLTDSMENWSLMLKKCHQEQHFVFEGKKMFLFVVVFFFFTFISGSKHRIWSITEFWEIVCCIFSFHPPFCCLCMLENTTAFLSPHCSWPLVRKLSLQFISEMNIRDWWEMTVEL